MRNHHTPLTARLILILVTGITLLSTAAVLAAAPAPPEQSSHAQTGPTPLPRGADVLDIILRADPYRAWQSWPTDLLNPADFTGYLPSAAPHGTALRLFVNNIARNAAADPAFSGTLPPGSIIVQEDYAVTHDSPAALVALTVMAKYADFDPRNGDWFWLKASPDGRLIEAEGSVKTCQTCHEQSQSDYQLAYLFAGAMPVDNAAALGSSVVDARCTACHARALVDGATYDAAGWELALQRHVGRVTLSEAERLALLAYLTRPRGTGAAQPATTPGTGALDGNAVLNLRCTTCHARTVIDMQVRDAAGWEQVLAGHAGRVVLTPEERAALLGVLVQITGTGPIQPPVAPGGGAGLDGNAMIGLYCTACHSRAVVDGAGYDAAGWAGVLSRHAGRVALSPEQGAAIIAYLTSTGGGTTGGGGGDGSATCTTCHAAHPIQGSPGGGVCLSCHTPHGPGGPGDDDGEDREDHEDEDHEDEDREAEEDDD